MQGVRRRLSRRWVWTTLVGALLGALFHGHLAALSAAELTGDWSIPAGLERARVVYVHDGDTIDVMLDGRRTRVRYIGIDTPELSDDRPQIQALARTAWAANRELVLGREILLEWDAQRYDVYGRVLAYVYLEPATFVNGWLVEQGLARTLTIPPNTRHREPLRALEAQARASGRGIWAVHSKPLEVMNDE